MDLQHSIEDFVDYWAPRDDQRDVFIKQLRGLMNAYAEAAIAHGAVPEKNVPHGGKQGSKS